MPSALTWLDHDATERERMQRVLALFQERGTVDELGLGSIRDALADHLFPGTSTIQTRLRYFLIVPWIYRWLERNHVPSAQMAARARQMELRMVEPLLSGNDAGVFGRMAGQGLKRLPSSVYWGGLRGWGIRQFEGSADDYHRSVDEIYRRRRLAARADNGGRGDLDLRTWHPALPVEPPEFPELRSLRLTRTEAGFILDRIRASHAHSYLRVLAELDRVPGSDFPWEVGEVPGLTKGHRTLLHHARLFSELREGAPILYNLQLAEIAGQEDLVQDHRAALDTWREYLDLFALRQWSLAEFWPLTEGLGHTVTPSTREFVSAWLTCVRATDARVSDDRTARELVRRREAYLKGARSRFSNRRVLDERWGGYAGIGRFDYRWVNVGVLLGDLHDGLAAN